MHYLKFIIPAIIFSIFVNVFATNGSAGKAETVYVIQVKMHTNVKVIESAKKSLMAKYPDKKFLIQFRSPQYILSIGYFATEAEANEFKKNLEKEYPDSKVLPVEKK